MRMIDKKFLEALGITDEETVKKITAEYAADIKTEKDDAENGSRSGKYHALFPR